jgi:hypothetical protein
MVELSLVFSLPPDVAIFSGYGWLAAMVSRL